MRTENVISSEKMFIALSHRGYTQSDQLFISQFRYIDLDQSESNKKYRDFFIDM